MREINKYTVEKVEKCVCEYFNLDYQDVVVQKSRQRDCSNARHFIMRILHEDFMYSISTLSSHYNTSGRTIERACANVRNRCKIYKEYKKHYDIITTVLLDLDVG